MHCQTVKIVAPCLVYMSGMISQILSVIEHQIWQFHVNSMALSDHLKTSESMKYRFSRTSFKMPLSWMKWFAIINWSCHDLCSYHFIQSIYKIIRKIVLPFYFWLYYLRLLIQIRSSPTYKVCIWYSGSLHFCGDERRSLSWHATRFFVCSFVLNPCIEEIELWQPL